MPVRLCRVPKELRRSRLTLCTQPLYGHDGIATYHETLLGNWIDYHKELGFSTVQPCL